MRTWTKLSILAFIGAGAGSLLAACGDNSQTCGPGTEPDQNGVCTPTGSNIDGGDEPDMEIEPDMEVPDADLTPTTTGTLAITDTTIVDPTAALAGGVRGGAIRMSFSDLTMPGHHGGLEVYRQNAGAPVQGCLVQQFDATHQPNTRLDGGPITISGPATGTSGLLKTVGPCVLQPLLGDPDPYVCVSNAASSATVGAQDLGASSAVVYTLAAPTIDFGTNAPVAITSLARSGGTVLVTTAAPHNIPLGAQSAATGFPLGAQFVTISGTTALTANITAIQRASEVVTVTAVHDLQAGNTVTIANVSDTSFNGTFTVTSVTAGVSFTYAQAGGANAGPIANSGTTTLRSYNGRFGVTATDATHFAYTGAGTTNPQAGAFDNNTTGGMLTTPTNAIASSVLSINGMPNANFNSGASAFPIIQQLDANTVVVVNSTPADGTSSTAVGAATYAVLNGFTPVPGAGANSDFLGRDGAIRIVKAANSVWPAIDKEVDIPGEALAPVANTSLVRASDVVTATVPTGHGYTTGQKVIIAGASPSTFNGTQTVTGSTATTFTYANNGTDETATTAGTAQRPSFALDPASNLLHMFPRVTAVAQSYGCDNDTTGDATDDTCGDTSTNTLKALIISGSATRRSVSGIFPFQMPTEVSGSDTAWLEWQCAFVGSKNVDVPVEMVQAILDFAPTRIEMQALFVAGFLEGDGSLANEGQLRILAGHALAGHATFSRATGTDGFGLPVSHQCNDGIDNEGSPDGLIDFGFDPGCTSPADTTE